MHELINVLLHRWITATRDRETAYHLDAAYLAGIQQRRKCLDIAADAMLTAGVPDDVQSVVLTVLTGPPPDETEALQRIHDHQAAVDELNQQPARVLLTAEEAAQFLRPAPSG